MSTAGQELASALRRYFSVGPRTRRYRSDRYRVMHDLHADMVEGISLAAQYPGAYCPGTQEAFQSGYSAALSYDKHVRGYRISGTLACEINAMSPWDFAAMLGAMIDAGVTCTGDGERFFAEMARAERETTTAAAH